MPSLLIVRELDERGRVQITPDVAIAGAVQVTVKKIKIPVLEDSSSVAVRVLINDRPLDGVTMDGQEHSGVFSVFDANPVNQSARSLRSLQNGAAGIPYATSDATFTGFAGLDAGNCAIVRKVGVQLLRPVLNGWNDLEPMDARCVTLRLRPEGKMKIPRAESVLADPTTSTTFYRTPVRFELAGLAGASIEGEVHFDGRGILRVPRGIGVQAARAFVPYACMTEVIDAQLGFPEADVQYLPEGGYWSQAEVAAVPARWREWYLGAEDVHQDFRDLILDSNDGQVEEAEAGAEAAFAAYFWGLAAGSTVAVGGEPCTVVDAPDLSASIGSLGQGHLLVRLHVDTAFAGSMWGSMSGLRGDSALSRVVQHAVADPVPGQACLLHVHVGAPAGPVDYQGEDRNGYHSLDSLGDASGEDQALCFSVTRRDRDHPTAHLLLLALASPLPSMSWAFGTDAAGDPNGAGSVVPLGEAVPGFAEPPTKLWRLLPEITASRVWAGTTAAGSSGTAIREPLGPTPASSAAPSRPLWGVPLALMPHHPHRYEREYAWFGRLSGYADQEPEADVHAPPQLSGLGVTLPRGAHRRTAGQGLHDGFDGKTVFVPRGAVVRSDRLRREEGSACQPAGYYLRDGFSPDAPRAVMEWHGGWKRLARAGAPMFVVNRGPCVLRTELEAGLEVAAFQFQHFAWQDGARTVPAATPAEIVVTVDGKPRRFEAAPWASCGLAVFSEPGQFGTWYVYAHPSSDAPLEERTTVLRGKEWSFDFGGLLGRVALVGSFPDVTISEPAFRVAAAPSSDSEADLARLETGPLGGRRMELMNTSGQRLAAVDTGVSDSFLSLPAGTTALHHYRIADLGAGFAQTHSLTVPNVGQEWRRSPDLAVRRLRYQTNPHDLGPDWELVRALAESESAATTSDYLTQCVTFRVVPEAAFADLAAPREIATVGGAVLEWTGSPALGGTGRFRVRYPSGGAVHTFYASPPSTGDPLDGNPWDIWSAAEDAGSLQSNTWTVAWGVGWCACARGRAGSTPPTEARLFGEGVLPDSPPDYPELHVWRDASRSTVFEATPAVVQPAHPDGFFGKYTQSDRDPWTERTVAELTAYGPQPSPFQVMESMTAIFQKNNRSSNREQGGLLAADRAHLYDGPFNQLWGEDSPFFADPSIPTTARMIRLVPAAQIRDEAWMGDDEEATTLRWKTRDYF